MGMMAQQLKRNFVHTFVFISDEGAMRSAGLNIWLGGLLPVLGVAYCMFGCGSKQPAIGTATPTSISVAAASATISTGATDQFIATGTSSNGTTQNLTSQVSWSSSNTAVATINATGLATAIGAGSANIQALLGGVSGSMSLTVTGGTLQTIAVAAPSASITPGSTDQFIATGTSSNGTTQNLTSQVSWSSSNTAVATINTTGLATAIGAGTANIQASLGGVTGSTGLTVTSAIPNFVGVLTQHNDNGRTGQNLNETQLTTADVNTTSFGKLFSVPVDGYIYAQPLYIPNVSIADGVHNVVYVATEGDSVFAFDADSGASLWQASLIDTAHGGTPGETTGDMQDDLGCTDLVPQVGITSTPVIDPSGGVIYVETKSKESDGTYIHRLHMIVYNDVGSVKRHFSVHLPGSVFSLTRNLFLRPRFVPESFDGTAEVPPAIYSIPTHVRTMITCSNSPTLWGGRMPNQ